MRGRAKRDRLKARVEYLEMCLAQEHRREGVVARWARELRRTRAMLRALDDGRPAGAYPDYLERAGGVS